MPPRKEEEIVIPEAVMNRANAAAMRGQAIADTGSIFTNRERAVDFRGTGTIPSFSQQSGLPRFPFGGASSTSLDVVDRSFNFGQYAPAGGFTRTNPNTTLESTQNQANVQYTQDAATRMANRYTLPTASFGNPLGSRLSNTLYSNPERAANIEGRGAELNTYSPLPTSPNVGAAGFSRNIETSAGGGGGGRVEQIVSPYGFASTNLTPQQEEQRWRARQNAEQAGTMPRTPERQQELLSQIREAGAGIKQRIAQDQQKFDQESIQRGYAFRQGLAETQAARALDDRFFKPDVNRGAQLLVEAERWKQAQTGRNPMSNEPFNVRGMQFRGVGMGQFNPVEDLGKEWQRNVFGGPQPAAGFMASGLIPSFTSTRDQSQEIDGWLRNNYPQDYYTTPFGGRGKRMIARPTPWDQTIQL